MPPEPSTEQDARQALAANPFPPTPWVKIGDDGIIVATGYSDALNRLLRWMPKAKWRPGKRSWLIPFSSAEALRAVLPELIRLAEAARELEAPEMSRAEAKSSDASDSGGQLQVRFAEAAELLHGANWRAALAGEPGDATFTEVIDLLRRKAEALNLAADRLEESVHAPRGGTMRAGSP